MGISPKNTQINIRISEEDKATFRKMAEEKSTSITELILSGLKGLPVRDYTHEKQFLQYLFNLTKELNYLGNNINQVTIAIHQINNGHKIPANEFAAFNALLRQYLESRDILSKQISEIFFNRHR
jgi:hypothetical protein